MMSQSHLLAYFLVLVRQQENRGPICRIVFMILSYLCTKTVYSCVLGPYIWLVNIM